MAIERRYKRGIRKVYQPVGWDRFDPSTPARPGDLVLVVAAWGPFRGLESLEGRYLGSCGKGSLQPAPR